MNTSPFPSRLRPALIASLAFMLASSAPAQLFTTVHIFTASHTNASGVYTNSEGVIRHPS